MTQPRALGQFLRIKFARICLVKKLNAFHDSNPVYSKIIWKYDVLYSFMNNVGA